MEIFYQLADLKRDLKSCQEISEEDAEIESGVFLVNELLLNDIEKDGLVDNYIHVHVST